MAHMQGFIKAAVIKTEYEYTAVELMCDAVITSIFTIGIIFQLSLVVNNGGGLPVCAAVAAMVFLMFLAVKLFKRSMPLYAVPLSVFLLMLLLLNVNLAASFNSFVNGIQNSIGFAAAAITPQLSSQGAAPLSNSLFMLALSSVIVLAAALCVKNNILTVPVIVAAAVVLFSVFTDKLNITCLVLLIISLLFMLYRGIKYGKCTVRCSANKVNIILGLLPFAIFAAVIVTVGLFSINGLDTAKEELTAAADNTIYGNTQPLPQGNFNKLSGFAPTGRPQLKVVMSKPQSYYLRGYVGSIYTETGWQSLDNENLYKSSSLFYWLHKNSFYGYNQLAVLTHTLNEEAADNRIIISNIGASGKYIYTPYEVNAFVDNIINTNKIDDSRPIGSNVFGSRSYTLTAVDNQVKQYTVLLSEVSKASDDTSLSAYINNEAHYNEYVYGNYLQITPKAKTTLESILGEYESSGEHLSYAAAKQSILNTLTSGMQYTAAPQGNLKGDFVTAFLQESCQGCSVHFATAATLMLRYYGIPARYVEGYLITPDDVENALSNSEIIIDDTHAHAWAEYYQDGIGWLPFETTPPYMEVMESAEDISPINNESNKNNTADSSSANDNPDSDNDAIPDSPSEQANSSLVYVITTLAVVIIAAVLLVCLCVIIKRRLKLKRQYKSFKSKNINTAVLNQFNYCIRLLIKFGFINSQNDIYSVSEIAGSDCTEKFKKAFLVFQEARFSNHSVSSQQAMDVTEFLECTVSLIKEKRNFIKGFYDRFIACTYK